MTAMLLYLLTGVATGIQVWYLLIWAMWGRPTTIFRYVALMGAVILLLASALVIWAPRSSKIVAIFGIAMLWSLYGPALYITLMAPAFRWDGANALYLVPAILLVGSTAYACRAILLPEGGRAACLKFMPRFPKNSYFGSSTLTLSGLPNSLRSNSTCP